MRVCIDPGHGGIDRANRGPSGYVEADGVLDIALRIRAVLVSLGVQVAMTREHDIYVSLADRMRLAASSEADYFISVHTDASTSADAHGFTIYSPVNSASARALAESIDQRLRAAGRQSRGVRTRQLPDGRDYYYVIREATMPSVLVECAFHTNPVEEALLKKPEFRQTLAQAIATGFWQFITSINPELVAIFLDGKRMEFAGQLVDGVALVPIRALAEALGLRVEWDGEARAVRLTRLK